MKQGFFCIEVFLEVTKYGNGGKKNIYSSDSAQLYKIKQAGSPQPRPRHRVRFKAQHDGFALASPRNPQVPGGKGEMARS